MENGRQRNADIPWYQFDPNDYLARNYARVRSEDHRVVELVRDFFGRQFASGRPPAGLCGIDVGTGANLYPALSMLPFCESITLYEHAKSNLEWLAEQAAADWPSWPDVWSDFWSVLGAGRHYAELGEDPRRALARRVEVVPGSVFALDPAARRWDMGTMFFVAESITSEPVEFTAAVRGFLEVLSPGAPFCITFMENSLGYEVAGIEFPAVSIGRDDVLDCLAELADDVAVDRVGPGAEPKLRDGYSGMLVACGHTSGGERAGRAAFPGRTTLPSEHR
ncbi:SCO2525 family SAM-dependent methyltransferase [Umezawaea sp. NPDC059074]|uniref:SCO2525 family SAM-dependent methyltransferase n=1 Tax=Umezawaea sp. NPDC059074 TaxID=3346716 RepID=UPI0036CB0099